MTQQSTNQNRSQLRNIFRRDRWETITITAIIIGTFMLMQPFYMELFTWSFMMILTGTLGFVIASHFPEE
ncbi:hypothetical protein BTA51_03435 [Hahella sp. CCB-MM4]|uniref:hypothetical protein n=1 Tax=Hahella sp. (strain CCB-MM4) TaxID=1926491 RepID=UPI000B9A7B9F|nr:hypothetical protein [Hahella sp. CCB-MM4]OZG75437.1 hypothetical protein BTA51_03435 [Hahella sp. CCB-MM4]